MSEFINLAIEIGFLLLKVLGLFLFFIIVAALLDHWTGGRKHSVLRDRWGKKKENSTEKP